MKVLIATNETQGHEPGDFSGTVEGELVTVGSLECSRPDQCGCGRAFAGVGSSRSTTTAMVVDRPGLSRADVAGAIEDWLARDGWLDVLEPDDDPTDLVDGFLDTIDLIGAAFPDGTVVRRTGTVVFPVVTRAA